MELAKLILDLFRGREGVVAVASEDRGFHPVELDGPLKPEWLAAKHLAGEKCLGFYLMTTDNKVWGTCIDFDNKPAHPDPQWYDKIEALYYTLCQFGLTPLVEISQSGCAGHVWLFFEAPVDAWLIRHFWYILCEDAEIDIQEVYPRQDYLSGKGLGNLVRFPLWGESKFIDIEDGGKAIDPIEALRSITKIGDIEIRSIIYQISKVVPTSPPKPEEAQEGLSARVSQLIADPLSLLSKRWKGDLDGLSDASTSALLLSLSCEFVRAHVRDAEIAQAIRYWSVEHNYPQGQREDWIERTIAKAYTFLGQRTQETTRKVMTLKDCMTSYVESLGRGALRCIPTGISAFDDSVDGIRKGEVCVIAARPSAGKTAFILQAVEHAASLGNPVLIISEEMDVDSIGERQMLRHAQGVDITDKTQIDVLREAASSSMSGYAPVYFTSYLSTIDRIEDTVEEYVRMFGVKLVAIDYLQCVTSKGTSRYEDTTDASRRIKKMALRHGISIYLVSQLNRAVEYRGSTRPQMSDLKESGGIEQDADTIVFLARDHPSSSQLKLWFAKRRNGKIRHPESTTTYHLDTQTFGGAVIWEEAENVFEP